MDKLFKLLNILNESTEVSQRKLASMADMSVGMVNSLIREMNHRGLLNIQLNKKNKKVYSLTEKGVNFLENMMRERSFEKISLSRNNTKKLTTAVILAAGKNDNFDTPTGLLELDSNITMIDRTIHILKEFEIDEIYLVIGSQKELYQEYFKDSNVHLIDNDNYQWSGTMYSLSLLKDKVKDDFLLIEADHIFEKRLIKHLIEYTESDAMLITNLNDSDNDAYVELDENHCLYRVSKDIHQFNRIDGCMSGLHKISYKLYLNMLKQFSNNQNAYMNYEYVIENMSRIFKIPTTYIDDTICLNINTVNQYQQALKLFYPRIIKREKEYDKKQLIKIFTMALGLKEKDIVVIDYAGGLTNVNYKVKTKNQNYILRTPGKCTDSMISRTNEKYNSKIGYLLNLNVDTVYFNEVSGVKITKYINHAETLNGKTAQLEHNIEQTTELLRILHTSNVELKSTFDVEKELLKYERLVQDGNGSFYNNYENVRTMFDQLLSQLKMIGLERVPCHNDLVAENLIKNEKRMYLIDWEYAGYNDPMWDLASHLIECEFTEKNERLFLNYYFKDKEIEKNDLEKILIFKILQDILWSVWTMAKEAQGESFGSYGIDRMNRAIELMKQYKSKYGVKENEFTSK